MLQKLFFKSDNLNKFKKKSEEIAKREKTINAECEELKNKITSLNSELDASHQVSRTQTNEIAKYKSLNEQMMEQLESFQREKRRLNGILLLLL